MGKAIDEREVPSVPDDAPANKKRDSRIQHTRLSGDPTTFNFTNKEAEVPRELFAYSFPDSELQTIAEYTNVNAEMHYAAEAFLGTPHFHGKHWQPTTASELKIWIGILQYQGAHHCDQPIGAYWNTDVDAPVNASLGRYMGVTRWQQIQLYMKVSDPTKENEYDLQGKDYWRKVDPLATRFRERCRAGFQGGTHFAIDEEKKFLGRSQHTLQIDSKAARKGYKKYSLTTSGGYLIDFIYTSKKCAIAGVKKPAFGGPLRGRHTSQMIIDLMTLSLPKSSPGYGYTLWLDNFFTNEALLRELWRNGIAAAGTAKTGSGLPQDCIDMRANATTDHWGALGLTQLFEFQSFTINCKQGGPHRKANGCPKGGCKVRQQRVLEGGIPILCASWQDNNVVNFMTTAHSEADFRAYEKKDRKRRKRAIRMHNPALEGKALRIPRPYWEYNQHMGSTDQHSQLKASYTTSHPMRRVWWPLFLDLIDAASVNAFVVYRDTGMGGPLDHRKFLLAISKELREEGSRELHFAHFGSLSGGLQRMKWPRGPPKDVEKDTQHQRVKIKRGRCRVCLQEGTRGMKGNRGALVAISSNVDKGSISTRMSVTGCDVCRVPLCNNEYC